MKTEFIAYGVKILSTRQLPVQLPYRGTCDQQITLEFSENNQVNNDVLPFHSSTVRLHNRSVSLSSNLPLDANRKNVLRQWKLEIKGIWTFSWQNTKNRIQVYTDNSSDIKLFSFWFLHTVLPVYLMLKKSSFFLHASAIAVENQALLFLAPSFGGKSTLADHFVSRGYPLLADDKIRLHKKSNQFLAFPSHPYRRPDRQIELLGYVTEQYESSPLPTNLFYQLNHVHQKNKFSINAVAGLKKFECLQKSYLYEPLSLTKEEIKNILSIVERCRLYEINIPYGLDRIPETCKAILEHAGNQKRP